MKREKSAEFNSGALKIYNSVSKKIHQIIPGDGFESLGYSWDADGEWLAVGCPTYSHKNDDGTSIPCLGRVKIYKAYHQKNANGELLYYDSSNNQTTTSTNNGAYIQYEKFGPDILGEITSETNKKPAYQFFGYCVKIEKPKKMGYKSAAKAAEDRYPHIAVGAPFRGYDHPGGVFRHEMVGAIYLYHPIYLNENIDPASIPKQEEKQASKLLTFKADGSIATQSVTGEKDSTFTSVKTHTDRIGNRTVFNK